MLVMNNDNICENDKLIELTHSFAQVGCLKQSNFSNNLVVCLPLELSFGDLKSLDDYDRCCLKKLYYLHDDYSPFEEGYIFQNEIKKLKKYVTKAKKIRIWSSYKCANEFLLLLYICYLFSDKNISVVFADEYNSYCWSIGCMDFREVNELSKKEHVLTKKEVEDYAEQWKTLVKENSDIRYIENRSIKSVPINYFDESILSCLGNREIRFMKLVGELIANAIIDNNSDSIYSYLINRLIEQGKIEVVRIDENGKKIIKATNNI